MKGQRRHSRVQQGLARNRLARLAGGLFRPVAQKWVSGNPYLAASAFPKGLLRANSTKLIATMNVQPDMKLVVNANDDVGVPFAALEVDQCHWPVTSLYVRTDCFGKTHWSHRFCADFVEPGTRPYCASLRRLAFNGKPDLGYSLDKQTSYVTGANCRASDVGFMRGLAG